MPEQGRMMKLATFDRAIGDWAAPLPHHRFSVYRNNVVAALVNALRVRFPVTEQLTGQRFFAGMAREYAGATRPGSPVLIGYGTSFPDFIEGFAPAQSVAYLADVARLENLWWDAYHAADALPVSASALAMVTPEQWAAMRFVFHPSVKLMASPYAVASIWHAHNGGAPMAKVATEAAEHVLVSQAAAEVDLRLVSAEAHDFMGQLLTGACLGDAVDTVSITHPDFDISSHLSGLLGLNIITGLAT
jgi:hypothetical protein